MGVLFQRFGITVVDDMAGRFTLWWGEGDWSIHFLPKKPHRLWGRVRDHYDGIPMHSWGLGPLLLVCWFPYSG